MLPTSSADLAFFCVCVYVGVYTAPNVFQCGPEPIIQHTFQEGEYETDQYSRFINILLVLTRV